MALPNFSADAGRAEARTVTGGKLAWRARQGPEAATPQLGAVVAVVEQISVPFNTRLRTRRESTTGVHCIADTCRHHSIPLGFGPKLVMIRPSSRAVLYVSRSIRLIPEPNVISTPVRLNRPSGITRPW